LSRAVNDYHFPLEQLSFYVFHNGSGPLFVRFHEKILNDIPQNHKNLGNIIPQIHQKTGVLAAISARGALRGGLPGYSPVVLVVRDKKFLGAYPGLNYLGMNTEVFTFDIERDLQKKAGNM
jgi:hypothetical protein